jgi:hypothetical protein
MVIQSVAELFQSLAAFAESVVSDYLSLETPFLVDFLPYCLVSLFRFILYFLLT